jgi:hypothetical protein
VATWQDREPSRRFPRAQSDRIDAVVSLRAH